jgi:hypothetical protein
MRHTSCGVFLIEGRRMLTNCAILLQYVYVGMRGAAVVDVYLRVFFKTHYKLELLRVSLRINPLLFLVCCDLSILLQDRINPRILRFLFAISGIF